MHSITYVVCDQTGHRFTGHSDARTKEELLHSLQAKGLVVISLEEGEKGAHIAAKGKTRLRKRVRIDDLIIFARQFAVLLEAGVPILKAVNILSGQLRSERLLEASKRIEEAIRTGSSLSGAISKDPSIFSRLWVDLIETGEATGQLAPALQKLAGYFEGVWAIRRKVVAALIYPSIMLLVAIAAVLIFMCNVIPVFASIYKGFTNLPLLTVIVINISSFLTRNLFKVMVIAAGSFYFLGRFIKTEKGRRWFDSLKLRLPVAGDLFLSMAVERFSTTLAMMLKGGVSIIHGLEVAIKSTANVLIEEGLGRVRTSVIQGENISQPLAAAGIFPPLVTQMISVGEESGKLSQFLDEVAKFYNEDVSAKVTTLVSLLEPVIIVVMGVVIGVLIVAMYLPIFTLATAAGGGGI